MGATLAQIQNTLPELPIWLSRVFSVFGGYMLATGLLTVYMAATSFRTRQPGATAVVCISGLASIGLMVITNFMIDSDFKWLLMVFSLPWIVALLLSWISTLSLLKNR